MLNIQGRTYNVTKLIAMVVINLVTPKLQLSFCLTNLALFVVQKYKYRLLL
jgi:hypothetical protein